MVSKKTNLSAYEPDEIPNGEALHIGIVVAEWNPEVTQALLQGTLDALKLHQVKEANIQILHVPGSFELPSGAQLLIEKHSLDAVIVLGCVIQGETRHFDFICQGVTQGVMELSLRYKTPVIYGLLTTNNQAQALDRAGGKHGNKGIEAAVTAIKMAAAWKH